MSRQRAQLADTRAAIAEAEKRAAERLGAARTEQVEDLRSALRILEAGNTKPDTLVHQPAAIPVTDASAASEEPPLDSPSPEYGNNVGRPWSASVVAARSVELRLNSRQGFRCAVPCVPHPRKHPIGQRSHAC